MSNRWKPPRGLDAEVRNLCVALNSLPGIETTGSCCGHGRAPFRIWFVVTDFAARGFVTLARCTCPRYYPWQFDVRLDHGDVNQVAFLLEGPPGCFLDADRLAAILTDHVLGRTEGYNILLDQPPARPLPRRASATRKRRTSA